MGDNEDAPALADLDLAQLSRSIDPGVLGLRLKGARAAAGLTQAQVAADDITPAYLSRIEAGQRRPEYRLLGRMADRIGVPLHDLLVGMSRDRLAELRLELDYADLELRGGDAATAEERARSVAESAREQGSQLVELAATRLWALAAEAQGELHQAIKLLQPLCASPVHDLAWLRSTIVLCRCYREAGELDTAVQLGEAALASASAQGLDGVLETVQLSLSMVAAHYERGDTSLAIRLCEQVIEASERQHSPEARASAYWNASILESHEGRLDSALALAGRALAAFEAGEDSRSLGRIRTQLGILLLRGQDPAPEEARRTLQQASRELEWSSASQVDRADNLIAQARSAFLLGDYDEARQHLEKATELAGGRSPRVSAEALALHGQIAMRAGRTDEARDRYREAIHEFSSAGSDRSAAQLWFELAELLDEVSDYRESAEAYRRAAASTGLVRSRSVAVRG